MYLREKWLSLTKLNKVNRLTLFTNDDLVLWVVGGEKAHENLQRITNKLLL